MVKHADGIVYYLGWASDGNDTLLYRIGTERVSEIDGSDRNLSSYQYYPG